MTHPSAPQPQSKCRLSSNTNPDQDETSIYQRDEEGRLAKRLKSAYTYHADELTGPDSKDRLTGRKSKGGGLTEQDLRRIIYKAIESPFPGASAIHPTAAVIANAIVVSSIPLDVFCTIRSLLPSMPDTVAWKLEFHPFSPSTRCSRRTRGRLVATMPSRVHEAFIPFSNDIAEQLYKAPFLPPMYKRTVIKQSGSTELKGHVQGLVPDAGISFFDSSNTFLVLDVAYSQREADAKTKAQRYILETNGKITFVVLVIVTKIPRKETSDPQQYPKDHLSPDHDTVHVHVYKSVRLPPDTLTGEHVVKGIQIFPTAAPAGSFMITWPDINCGTWSDFCDGAHLRSDTPEPKCNIKFDALVSIARDLAGQADDVHDDTPLYRPVYSNNVTTPIRNKRKFVDSPSPAVTLPSGGTVTSDEERRLDPDWKPSLESDSSSESFDSSR